jgi:hypothetical protein
MMILGSRPSDTGNYSSNWRRIEIVAMCLDDIPETGSVQEVHCANGTFTHVTRYQLISVMCGSHEVYFSSHLCNWVYSRFFDIITLSDGEINTHNNINNNSNNNNTVQSFIYLHAEVNIQGPVTVSTNTKQQKQTQGQARSSGKN